MSVENGNPGLKTSRRAVVGGLGAVALGAEIGAAQGAETASGGKIYGVYTGTDMKSYLCVLTGSASMPAYRMSISGPLPPPSWQDMHISTFWGGVTLILAGALEIGVSGGTMKSVVGKPGDSFVLIDTQGDGHSAARRGDVPLHVVQVRLREPWLALQKGFKGWPANVLPPKEFPPRVNY